MKMAGRAKDDEDETEDFNLKSVIGRNQFMIKREKVGSCFPLARISEKAQPMPR